MRGFAGVAILFGLAILGTIANDEDVEEARMQFIVEYFLIKGVKTVTSLLCTGKGTNIRLKKLFSQKGITNNWMDLSMLNESSTRELLSLKFARLGLVLDLGCPRGLAFLQMASDEDLLIYENSPTFWLVIHEKSVEENTIQKLADEYEETLMDPIDFLLEPYGDQTNDSLYFELNKRLNKEVVEDVLKNSPGTQTEKNGASKTRLSEVEEILKLKVLMDNEVVLAVRGTRSNRHLYTLYSIYKPTAESRPEVNVVGAAVRNPKNGKFEGVNVSGEKRNFGGTILRAGCMVYQADTFTTLDDLSKRDIEIWPKVSYDHIKMLSEDLNFRVVIRFFSDYGWEVNGTYTHLLASFKQKKSLLSATGALMRAERFNVIDYTMCPFRFQVGILFKEPSLPSVSNIFILSFSEGIWISIVLLILVVVLAMVVRPLAFKLLRIDNEVYQSDPWEIVVHVLGAICQQGFSMSSTATSERTIILFLLTTSLILFSSYSAYIVTLLQSYSSAITSISDVTKSEFEVGVQAHFPVLDVYMKEAKHPVLREYFNKKIINKRGKIYYETREGIEKMRKGMFAFEADLNGGYNVIRQTFDEQEKCGIKVLDLAPKPYVCFPVGKSSSYKKIFTRRLIWQEEMGLFDRSWKRWMDLKPKCEVNRVGFISVGHTEIEPILWIFIYGTFASLVVFFLELLLNKRSFKAALKIRTLWVKRFFAHF